MTASEHDQRVSVDCYVCTRPGRVDWTARVVDHTPDGEPEYGDPDPELDDTGAPRWCLLPPGPGHRVPLWVPAGADGPLEPTLVADPTMSGEAAA